MTSRQRALPRRWLMTDERIGDRLWNAIARLPAGESGIVFRHYATGARERETLAHRVAEACRHRGITLAVARDIDLARSVGANLVHNPAGDCPQPFSLSVHTTEEARSAGRRGAALVFVSPVHPTWSHPGGAALGAMQAVQLARAAGVPAVALGGMDEAGFDALPRDAFHGWAGIDAWISKES
jgi:thiamine-phosphate pyrophosphorylase